MSGTPMIVPIQQLQMLQSQPISIVQLPQQHSETIIVKEQPSPTPQFYRVKSMTEEPQYVPTQQYVNMGVPLMTTTTMPNVQTVSVVSSTMSPPRSISSNSLSSNHTPSIVDSGNISALTADSSVTSGDNSSSKLRRPIQKRNRSAAREDLKFIQIQEDGSNEVAQIRVWVNDKNMAFYDCSCEKRKPVQDLNKIKLHVMGHLIKRYTCQVCQRDFANYRQLNGHLRIHQTNKRKEVPMLDEKPSCATVHAATVPTFMGPPAPPGIPHVLIVEAAHASQSLPQSVVYNVYP